MAERGGFEPAVPRGLLRTEFGPSLARYSARQKASVLERICSPRIRLCFGSLRFASFARLKADAREAARSSPSQQFASCSSQKCSAVRKYPDGALRVPAVP
jgi:hypothetical protein